MVMSLEDEKAAKLLDKVLDRMLEGFQVIGRDWRYLYVNKTVADQGKRSKEDLIGKTMMESYPGIENTELFKNLQKSMNEKVSVRMDNEFTYPDGSKGWFELFIHPWEEGIMIFSIDNTQRKDIEFKLFERIQNIGKLADFAVGQELKIDELKKQIAGLQVSVEELKTTTVV